MVEGSCRLLCALPLLVPHCLPLRCTAAWSQIPVEHQEDTQILRYGIGQFYKVHAPALPANPAARSSPA